MSNFSELIRTNTEAADAIANPDAPFDDMAADLILRNAAIAADRLAPWQFVQLSTAAQDAVFDLVGVATQIAPLPAADREQMRHETPAQHNFRITVQHPLFRLQSAVTYGNYAKDDPNQIRKLKLSVKLAGAAFAGIVAETQNEPAIAETEVLFWNNASAASQRVLPKQ